MTYQNIKKILQSQLYGQKLTDAHRHSLYDIGKVKGMDGLPVEYWNKYNKFVEYQKKQNHYTENIFFMK